MEIMGMITLDDIINISFRKANFGGYRPDDVDAFIDNVQESYDSLQKENSELLRKLKILAAKVEEYREQEESIRTTLMNAQKLADASVREAKHKSEVILTDATMKAERIVANAQKEVEAQQSALGHLQSEVATFRSRLLSIYKEHLTLIDALPTEESLKQKEVAKQQETTQDNIEEAPEPYGEAITSSSEQQEVFQQQEENVKQEEEIIQPKEMDEKSPVQPVQPVQTVQSAQPLREEIRSNPLKFGEDYDIHEDYKESPLGLFSHKNK